MNNENNRAATIYRESPTSQVKKKGAYRKRNQKRQWMTLALAAIVLIFLCILLLRGCKPSSPVVGKWDLDGITSYEFKRNGKGSMILPSSQYRFEYEIDGDKLSIDFEYDGARDAEYLFTVTEDQLILDGGNSFTRGVYVLTKQD